MSNRTIERVTKILEVLAERPLWRLAEITERVDLPAATCARLLAQLQESGWVDQLYARGPYRLGPRVHALAEERPYLQELLRGIQPHLSQLVKHLQQPVVVVGLRAGKRHVLLVRTPDGQANEQVLVTDDELFASATGRLLFAHLPLVQRQALLAHIGLPTAGQWSGIDDRSALWSECRLLRRRGWAGRETAEWHTRAVFIGMNETGVSLGTYAVPGALHDDSLSALQQVQRGLAT